MAARFQIFEAEARGILSATSGFIAEAGFTHSLTPARNCTFGCTYCYVPTMRVHGGLKPEDWRRWGQFTTFKSNAAELLGKETRQDWRIYCSPLVDPYQPAEETARKMPAILDALIERPPAVCTIQTRGPLIARDVGRLRALARRTRLRVSVSLTTDRERVRRLFEPHCAPVVERVAAMRALRAAGIATFATLAPLLPCDPEELAGIALRESDEDVIGDPLHVRETKPRGATTRPEAYVIAARHGFAEWMTPDFQAECVEANSTNGGSRWTALCDGNGGIFMAGTSVMSGVLESLGVEEVNAGVSGGAAHGGELPSINPANGAKLARVRMATAEDYERVVAEAAEVFARWRMMPAPRRGEIVREIGDELRAHKDDLGALVTLEMGKILAEGRGEVQEMIDIADFAVGLSRQLYGLTMHSERPGPPHVRAVASAGHRGRDQRLQFPGGGVVVERHDRGGVRRLRAVEALARKRRSPPSPCRRSATACSTGTGWKGVFNLVIGKSDAVGETLIARPAHSAGERHRLDRSGPARRRSGGAAAGPDAFWNWAATTASS